MKIRTSFGALQASSTCLYKITEADALTIYDFLNEKMFPIFGYFYLQKKDYTACNCITCYKNVLLSILMIFIPLRGIFFQLIFSS